MNGFGNFLKELRASSEFAGDEGAKKLAEILGCSRATIYNWERRKSPPTMLNRELFCKTFDIEDCKLEPSNFTGIFAEKIRLLMSNEGLTQDSFAQKFGVSQRAVCGWLNGAMPRPGKIKKIAEYFGVPVNVLTDDSLPLPSEYSAGTDSALSFLRGAINARLVAALSDYADQSGDSDAKEAAKFVALVFAKISTSNR